MIESRYADLDDQTVGFETNMQHLGAAPHFRGVPGDVAGPDPDASNGVRGETYVEGDCYVAVLFTPA